MHYLGPSQGKWVTSVYHIVRLGIVRIATQTALHSTRRMCIWARQGRNVWIVGVVGEKQTPPVIPPIPASSVSADVDLTKLRSSGYQVSMQGSLHVWNITATAARPALLPSCRKSVLSKEPARPLQSAYPTAAWHRASSSPLYTGRVACLFFIGTFRAL